MPYTRLTLTELRTQVANDIAAEQPGSDPFLRFSPLKITGKIQAGLTSLQYGYLDNIAKNSVPFTAVGEYRRGWAALKRVYVEAATATSLQVTFPGTQGYVLDSGISLVRGDGVTYTATTSGTVGANNQVTVNATADVAGVNGNCDTGSILNMGVAIQGVQSSGTVVATLSEGTDQETEDDFFARMIAVYQAPPQGGAQSDYVGWAKNQPGITRAWCNSNGFGAGSVVVYVMLDVVNAAENGFPQGSDGVSSSETRSATIATGDQLVVANALYSLRPATALVYICSPLPNSIAIVISGLSNASTAVRTNIQEAIADVFTRNATPTGSSVNRSDITDGIGAVSGSSGYVINSLTGTAGGVTTTYAGNITSGLGYLSVLTSIIFV